MLTVSVRVVSLVFHKKVLPWFPASSIVDVQVEISAPKLTVGLVPMDKLMVITLSQPSLLGMVSLYMPLVVQVYFPLGET